MYLKYTKHRLFTITVQTKRHKQSVSTNSFNKLQIYKKCSNKQVLYIEKISKVSFKIHDQDPCKKYTWNILERARRSGDKVLLFLRTFSMWFLCCYLVLYLLQFVVHGSRVLTGNSFVPWCYFGSDIIFVVIL